MMTREQVRTILQALPLAEGYEERRLVLLSRLDDFNEDEVARAEQFIYAFIEEMKKSLDEADRAIAKVGQRFRDNVEQAVEEAEGTSDAALAKLQFIA